jgi:hypothetical protein
VGGWCADSVRDEDLAPAFSWAREETPLFDVNRVHPLDNLKAKLVEKLVTPSTGDIAPSLMYEVLKYSPPNEALLFLQGQ